MKKRIVKPPQYPRPDLPRLRRTPEERAELMAAVVDDYNRLTESNRVAKEHGGRYMNKGRILNLLGYMHGISPQYAGRLIKQYYTERGEDYGATDKSND